MSIQCHGSKFSQDLVDRTGTLEGKVETLEATSTTSISTHADHEHRLIALESTVAQLQREIELSKLQQTPPSLVQRIKGMFASQ